MIPDDGRDIVIRGLEPLLSAPRRGSEARAHRLKVLRLLAGRHYGRVEQHQSGKAAELLLKEQGGEG